MSASPAPTTSSGVPIKPPTRDASPHQPRILCVEDNKINMMLVTTYLKKKKYPFEMAFDGAEAFDKVKEEISRGRDFDCILMDLRKSTSVVPTLLRPKQILTS
jgi:PleD family two-component response regulator